MPSFLLKKRCSKTNVCGIIFKLRLLGLGPFFIGIILTRMFNCDIFNKYNQNWVRMPLNRAVKEWLIKHRRCRHESESHVGVYRLQTKKLSYDEKQEK